MHRPLAKHSSLSIYYRTCIVNTFQCHVPAISPLAVPLLSSRASFTTVLIRLRPLEDYIYGVVPTAFWSRPPLLLQALEHVPQLINFHLRVQVCCFAHSIFFSFPGPRSTFKDSLNQLHYSQSYPYPFLFPHLQPISAQPGWGILSVSTASRLAWKDSGSCQTQASITF